MAQGSPPPLRLPIAWVPLAVAMGLGAALAGVAGWRLHVDTLERQIAKRRAAVKKLVISGGITPNQQVVDYLNTRQRFLERHYQHWLETLTTAAPPQAAGGDPQLYFQERVHEVQRTLERLAAARRLPVPESLGFPKELPPADAVPRLLVQLALIQDSAAAVFEQGVTALASLKIEDPEPVSDGTDHRHEAFLTRLPIRAQMRSALPQLMKVLTALERLRPIVDVQGVSIQPVKAADASSDQLQIELILARYILAAPTTDAKP